MMKLLYKNILIVSILLFSGALGFIFSWHHQQTLDTFVPPSDVTVIQTFHYPALFAKQLAHDKDAGRKIFNQFCTSCHGKAPIIDIKAPHIGDKNAWKIRQKMGMDALMKITTMGVGAMPSRGGCFECTDDELRETIRYILQQSDAMQ